MIFGKIKALFTTEINEMKIGNIQKISKENFTHRLSADYLPSTKQVQDLQAPAQDKLSYENPIVGVAYYGDEFLFIFADGTKSDYWSTTDI